MATITKQEIINENEQLKAQVENLTLYLREMFRRVPYLRQPMMQKYNGMPGYTEKAGK